MSKKTHKTEEPATDYSAKKPAQSEVRYTELEKVRESNAKLMEVHRNVLQKLAK